MSADWFCKIGEKKYGPLNDKQLKTIVAKGQLKPEHLVRQGSAGPWVPAGRIKGLFPPSAAGNARSQGKSASQTTGKPLPKGAAKPGTPASKTTRLPTAAEAPAPPASDVPQELRLGGHHKHHVEMNVDSLNIDAMPVNVSRRKVKSGMRGLKKEEQKKLTVLLWCFGGGGIAIGLIVFISAIARGTFSTTKPEETAKVPAALVEPVDSGKKTEKPKDTGGSKPAKEKDIEGTRVQVKVTVGNVDVMVLKPTRGAPPEGVKTHDTEVLIVPVRLFLKEGVTKPIQLTSWFDDSLQAKVSLMGDRKTCVFFGQVAEKGSDAKTIRGEKEKPWLIVDLVFEVPNDKVKSLKLKLPAAAFQTDGPMLGFDIHPSDIRSDSAKPEKSDKGDQSTKSDKDDSKADDSKDDK